MIQIFYHVDDGPNWISVVSDQLNDLKPFAGVIHVGFLGTEKDKNLFLQLCQERQIYLAIDFWDENLKLYEYPTLQLLWNYSKIHPGETILYIHNKCSFFHNAADTQCLLWRRYMTHYIFNTPWHDKEFLVAGSLAVYTDPAHPDDIFFAGNFWYAKTDYVALLSKPETQVADRYPAETWIYEKIPRQDKLHSLLRLDDRIVYEKDMNQVIKQWATQVKSTDNLNATETDVGLTVLIVLLVCSFIFYWIQVISFASVSLSPRQTKSMKKPQ